MQVLQFLATRYSLPEQNTNKFYLFRYFPYFCGLVCYVAPNLNESIIKKI